MNRFLTSFITVLAITSLQAQAIVNSPKLVIAITIDQLRMDYLRAFAPLYGDNGFKKLWKEGVVFNNVAYDFKNPDRSSAIASLYSGATPSINGIIGNYWINRKNLYKVKSVEDENFIGFYSEETFAPTKLLCSTITDELKIATHKKGIVYAIAPNSDAAILSAGHCANGAFWVNPKTGEWAGTTYYKEFPAWISLYNDQESIKHKIDSMAWEPFYSKEKYVYLPEWREQEFYHKFSNAEENKFRRFITSPFVNNEVNRLAEKMIENSAIGKDDTTDFLALTYYGGNYKHESPQQCAMEIQDNYLRIDNNIAELLRLVDGKIGLKNVLVVITSTGYTDSDAQELGLYNIPTGNFYLNRCAALLNVYLMATYGEGKYVEGFFNNQIYLNHELIEKKQLNLKTIQTTAAEFLMQFSGVNKAYSAYELFANNNGNKEFEKRKNAFNRKCSGDLSIELLPGWNSIDENDNIQNVSRYNKINIPLFIFGYNSKPTIVDTPVTINQIAPTLAYFMQIRGPNGCKALPINF